jgi:amidase
MSAVSPDWPASSLRSDTPIAYYPQDGIVPAATAQQESVRHAAGLLTRHFDTVDKVLPPWLSSLYQVWDEIWSASGGARGLLQQYLTDDSMLSPSLARLVALSPSSQDESRLKAASNALEEIKDDAAKFMGEYPIVICPVSAGPPGQRSGRWIIEGVGMKGGDGFGYCYVWSLLGAPALSVSWTTPDGEPAAVQVIARPGHDHEAIAVGSLLERHLSPAPHPLPRI